MGNACKVFRNGLGVLCNRLQCKLDCLYCVYASLKYLNSYLLWLSWLMAKLKKLEHYICCSRLSLTCNCYWKCEYTISLTSTLMLLSSLCSFKNNSKDHFSLEQPKSDVATELITWSASEWQNSIKDHHYMEGL